MRDKRGKLMDVRWTPAALIRSSPYRPVLAGRLLRRVLAGIGVSSVGDGLSTVAIAWLAVQLAPQDQRALWVALAAAAYNLPGAAGTFLLAPWMRGRSGAQLAHWDALLRTAGLLMIPLAHAAGLLSVGLLVGLLALSSLLNSWGKSGRYVLLAELLPAEHRLAGNAVVNVVLELAYVAGPPLAALLLTAVHPSTVIGVDALTFAVMALIYRYGLPARLHAKRVADGASRSAGFGAIRRSRPTAVLVGMSFLFFFFFGSVSVALTVHVAEDLAASAATLAGYFTAFGIGGFIGAFGAGYLHRWSALRVSLAGVLGVGVFLLPLGAPLPVAVGWLCFGIAGLFWGPFPATTTAYLQAVQDGPDLAPVLAARTALQIFALPAGTLVAGPLVTVLGARTTLALAGGLIVAVAVGAAVLIATVERDPDHEPASRRKVTPGDRTPYGGGQMKLIIANSRTEEMVGDLSRLSETARKAGAWGAQRMLWFATDGDMVVLPWRPPEAYLDYVTGLTRTDPRSLTLLVPPPGELGTELLTPDRLADPRFQADLRDAVAGRTVTRVLTCFDDYAVVDLVEATGIADSLPGHRFSAQGGVGLVNSKAVFRAVATGAGVALAPGVVTHHRQHATRTIQDLLSAGLPAMIKQEFAGGGFGNRILAPRDGVRAAGATEVTVLDGPAEIDAYVAHSWDWMTGGQNHRVVVERFFTECTTVYAEFEVTDQASELSGTGQILMEPVAAGEIVPPPTLGPAQRENLVRDGRRLSDIFRALGYRGRLSADAIVTPDGELFFTETNGRVTGSTHLHTVIRARMLGSRADDRTLLERDSWSVPSFETAVAALRETGLAFDAARGTGVVITANYVPVTGAVMYCVVAEDIAAARAIEERMLALKVDAA